MKKKLFMSSMMDAVAGPEGGSVGWNPLLFENFINFMKTRFWQKLACNSQESNPNLFKIFGFTTEMFIKIAH